MDITVFYAWQDDRPGKYNRYLIRDAAREACRRISEEASNDYSLRLDEATLGAPGMCDIPNTILEKIRDCDVFLGDLTFVGRTDADNGNDVQLISNPNVLFELGYAVSAKGFERILGVMNVAYGEPERQMFDVKRRWALRYELPETAERHDVERARKLLSKEMSHALLTIIEKSVSPEKESAASQRFWDIWSRFESSVRDGSFHGLFRRSGTIAICVVPAVARTFDYLDLQRAAVQPLGCPEATIERLARSIVRVVECDDPGNRNAPRIRSGIAETTVDGTILVADTLFLNPGFYGVAPPTYSDNVVPSKALEPALVGWVVQYVKALHELGASAPWHLGVSFLGIRGFRMSPKSPYPRHSGYRDNDLIADPVIIPSFEEASTPESAARLLKDTFDEIRHGFGFPGSPHYDAEGNWQSPQ